MAKREDILNEFEQLNIQLAEDVLEKCVSICRLYNIDAEDFANQWWAFAASNSNEQNVPTVELLNQLERKELQKVGHSKKPLVSTPKNSDSIDVNEDDDLSSTSGRGNAELKTPKNNRSIPSKIHTPTPAKRLLDEINLHLASPGSQTVKYNQRTDSGSIKCSYGPINATFKNSAVDSLLFIKDLHNIMKPDTRYMFEVMTKKYNAINNMTDYLGAAILDKYKLVLSDGHLRNSVGEMITYGRIVSDSDGKINNQSLLLEGSFATNGGNTVQLNINKLDKYSLFPGQVVVLKGNHINTQHFIAEELYDDAPLYFNLEPPVSKDPMQIVVAAGPFTLQENVLYEPLTDLLKYVIQCRPHVLLLIGPFLEATNDGVFSGELTKNFDTFFADLISNVMTTLRDVDTHVVIAASARDAHHHPVYPTMPYKIREEHKKLTFLPDPCMVDINNLVIAATSVDVLFDISNFEISFDKQSLGQTHRLGRIASHILKQQSFYPLYPTHSDIFIDHNLLEQHGMLDVKPHILILPSNLRHFVKNIDDCLVINPERLTKGYVGGTFTRIEISPGNSNSICDRVACHVLKI